MTNYCLLLVAMNEVCWQYKSEQSPEQKQRYPRLNLAALTGGGHVMSDSEIATWSKYAQWTDMHNPNLTWKRARKLLTDCRAGDP